MATFQTRGKSVRAIVRLNGTYDSKTFPRKSEAQAWAIQREAEITAGDRGQIPNKTFGDLLETYRDKVALRRSGARWETIRINRIVQGSDKYPPDPIAAIKLDALGPEHVADWRDRRLAEVEPGSVLREWNLLSGAVRTAIKEWRWMRQNPFSEVARPEKPADRDRRISDKEIESILVAAGYDGTTAPCTKTHRVILAFLFALQTGMRCGEIVALRRSEVFLDRRIVKVTGVLPGGRKTRSAKRDVPLLREAERILRLLPDAQEGDAYADRIFGLDSSQNVDALWRKIRDKSAIDDLTFHDSRHEAVTRLAKKMDVLALAKMIGHANVKQLMTYYNESAEDIAKRLD